MIDAADGGGENPFQSRSQALSLRATETKTKLVLKVTSPCPVSRSLGVVHAIAYQDGCLFAAE